ncbi:anti-sigma B factor antagonist [Nonomuraea thailandensis]|uniref:Anti-sigma factor antagonist n=1 Tax=Nonomuraea thailandensis TaxID=1188745 RepID=A0A9X2G8W0_9ACTN|nr:STAS domain-containing protein [Nonomuraea thailandensis]MCP2353385.1 anti-sigma B factor antagonist [Nonomuraea thailandensis]
MPLLSMHHQHHVGATVFILAGEIDLACAPGLHHFITEARRRPEDHLIFDMAGVTFMDSMGLRVLLDAFVLAERHGAAVHLTALHGSPARLLAITGLDQHFQLHSSTGIALATVAGAAAAAPHLRAPEGGAAETAPDRLPDQGPGPAESG